MIKCCCCIILHAVFFNAICITLAISDKNGVDKSTIEDKNVETNR